MLDIFYMQIYQPIFFIKIEVTWQLQYLELKLQIVLIQKLLEHIKETADMSTKNKLKNFKVSKNGILITNQRLNKQNKKQ